MNFGQGPRAVWRAFFLCTAGFGLGHALPALAAEATLSAPGADVALTDRLTAASTVMTTASQSADNVQELLAAALSDYRTLVQVLYDAGHFSPTVTIRLDGREAASIQPLYPPGRIDQIAITVDPGPRFTFGTAAVRPFPANSDITLPEGFATGQTATTGAIRDAGNAGMKSWRRAGHAKVQLQDQKITANHLQARLDAELVMRPGPKLRFGTLHVAGDTAVREDSLHRIAGFPSGEQFHPDALAKVGTRLRRTGTFASVSLTEALQPNPDGTLDVTATFEDLPPRRLTFGAELSSSDGLELTGAWMHRNLFGGAEKLRLEWRISGLGGTSDIDGRIGLRLDQPDALGADDSRITLLEVERVDEEHYKATQGLGAWGLRRVYSDTLIGEATLGFSSTLAEDAFGKRRFKFAFASFRVELDERNNRVSATSGYYLHARALPFMGVDGTKSGLQLKFDGRGYLGLGSSDRLVLAGRLQMGSVIGPGLNSVSPTLLFFSGGAGSVRGHEYQSLGVPVGTGIAGGRGYMALSAELRGKVTDKISLVGFYDVGLVDPDSFVSKSSKHHAGAGFGVRYDIAGIGPIRLDLAYPVEGGSADGLQFYIGIGQAF